MDAPVSVLIVAREPLLRRSLAACLAADPALRVAGSVGTAAEGHALADAALPAVALVGTTLPDAPGLAAAAELRRRHPALAVVVVAEAESDEGLFAAIQAGAAAYLDRAAPEDRLVALVREAAAGEYPINEQVLGRPQVAGRVLEAFRLAADRDPDLGAVGAYAPLTGRELEVLEKVRDGLTNEGIGHALGISTQTVKNHVTSILRKLAVNDRTGAVMQALRRGWLTADGDGRTSTDAGSVTVVSTTPEFLEGPIRP